MSTSPLTSCLGIKIKSLSSGQLAGEPSKGKLQACAGGSVTGAVPHIVRKNIGIIANLFIWKEMIVSHNIVYHN